jgi:hypothetical protein
MIGQLQGIVVRDGYGGVWLVLEAELHDLVAGGWDVEVVSEQVYAYGEE